MEFFLRITFGFAKVTGILVINYDGEKRQIIPCHVPSLIYGNIMKFLYVGACIFLFYKAYRDYNDCIGGHQVWQAVRLVVDFFFALNVIILCIETMYKRKEFFMLLSAFLNYKREFSHELCFYESKLKTYLMLMMVTLSVFCKIPFGLQYAINRPNYCGPEVKVEFRSTCFVVLWLLTLSSECCLLGAFLTGDILMDQVAVQSQKISGELSRLQFFNLSLGERNKWIQTINNSILKLIYQQRIVTLLVQKVIDNYICTLMVSLLNNSLQLIFIMAHQVSLSIEQAFHDKQLINFIFAMSIVFSLMQMFYLSDRVNKKYQLLQDTCYKSALKLKHPRNKMELILKNSLEILIVELRQEHYRLRFLHTFKVDLGALFAILCWCVNQLLVLLQKLWQTYIDEHKRLIKDRNEALNKIDAIFKKLDESIQQE